MGARGLCASVLLCVLAAWSTGPAFGQDPASLALQAGTAENPHTSPEDIEAGARVYRRSCSICHGADATGNTGPDLTRGTFRHGSSDRALFRNIRSGIPGTGMGGIYRPDTDIWQVVSYIRSLSGGAPEVEVPGNPSAGRRLYQSRGSCTDCHRLNGKGGRLGPDLSEIGYRRSPEHLRASISRPSDDVDLRFRTVRVVTREDEEVMGILRNEDSYSIQLFDDFERLRSFMKSDLKSIEKPETSLMPSMEGFFRGSDLDHLVAYLYSLKGEPR